MATGFPGYNGMVPKENGFLSEMLLAQGYATLGIGKWHLTLASEYASGASKARWPLSRGFERFYGFIGGKTNQWAPTLVHDNHYIDPPQRAGRGLPPQCRSRRPRDRVPDRPAHGRAGQAVLHVLLPRGRACAASRRARVDRALPRHSSTSGWDRWREEVFARQLEMGIVPPGTRLSPRPPWVKAWDSLSRRRAAPLRAADGGLRGVPRADRPPHRSRDRLPRAPGRARQHARHARIGQRRLGRGRRARLVQRELQFPNRVESTVEQNLAHLDDWGSVKSYPELLVGLGVGGQHAAAALEALPAPGRHERSADRALAEGHRARGARSAASTCTSSTSRRRSWRRSALRGADARSTASRSGRSKGVSFAHTLRRRAPRRRARTCSTTR